MEPGQKIRTYSGSFSGLGRLRAAGDRLTGGGLRVLGKRVLTASLGCGMIQPAVKAVSRGVLQPFLRLWQRVYRPAASSDALLTTSDIANATSPSPAEVRDCSLLVHSLYKTALGRLPDPDGLANCVKQLLSGVSLEALAEEVTASAEFQARHGSSPKIDTAFLETIYRDGLRRRPDPEGLAHWLAEGEKGVTRVKVLAAFAGSKEALDKAVNLANLAQLGDPCRLVNALYKAAFGRLAEPEGLANCVKQLLSGVSLEALAEELVASAEFQSRHGLSREVDLKYIATLYRDGPGRSAELESFAFRLARGKEGPTRAKVLAGVACSDKTVARDRVPAPESGMNYCCWVAAFDTITDADRAAIRAHIAGLPFRPIISVIMPAGTASEIALRESFSSIAAQLYPYWELCISTDTAAEPHLKAILRDWTARDPRIKMIELNTGDDVATAMNAALSLATGEFMTFLRAGDMLSEHALYEVAFALGGDGRPDIIYTDNDELNSGGQRVNPWFKPGWDPDLLLAQNYISGLAVYRRALMEAAGRLRPGFEGAEFHDLALRVTAASTPDRIRHIPAILYHRRGEKRTINSESAFPELVSINASLRAVRDYLDSNGNSGAVIKPAPQIRGAIRVVWPLPSPEPLVSVIIPTRDRADLLAQCIEGVLHRTDYHNLELLVVDNGSVEPATLTLFDRLLREESAVRILRRPGPFNYSALNNAAARESKGEVLLLMNNDIDVIDSSWLREMVSQALRPDVGIVGAKLLYANEQVQHGGIVVEPEGAVVHIHRLAARNDPGYFGQLALSRTLLAVTGACAAVRRAVFFEVGGLDEVNLPVGFNDVDLCLRLGSRGYRVVWTPFAELFHLESASRGLDHADPVKRARFLREWEHVRKIWGTLLDSGDPFRNPNLRFSWDRFEMPARPRCGRDITWPNRPRKSGR